MGGGAPVAVQTMTKTETANLDQTLAQIERCAEAGADLVRVAVPREEDAVALKTIVEKAPVPIIADKGAAVSRENAVGKVESLLSAGGVGGLGSAVVDGKQRKKRRNHGRSST